MLQPGTYPELVGKALVLEPDPFLILTHDDEPIAEGALLTALIGFAVGAAQIAGIALQQWAVPSSASTVETPWLLESAANPSLLGWLADPLREAVRAAHLVAGASAWWWLILLLAIPALLLLFWMLTGALLWVTGRVMGGDGTLSGVLGASALISAPILLYLLHLFPFTAINALLPAVWAMLLLYRAAQTSHDLSWSRAACVTLICVLIVSVVFVMLGATTVLLAELL